MKTKISSVHLLKRLQSTQIWPHFIVTQDLSPSNPISVLSSLLQLSLPYQQHDQGQEIQRPTFSSPTHLFSLYTFRLLINPFFLKLLLCGLSKHCFSIIPPPSFPTFPFYQLLLLHSNEGFIKVLPLPFFLSFF